MSGIFYIFINIAHLILNLGDIHAYKYIFVLSDEHGDLVGRPY